MRELSVCMKDSNGGYLTFYRCFENRVISMFFWVGIGGRSPGVE